MKILFKSIITTVCLLLTMNAFGAKSEKSHQDNLMYQDALYGLTLLHLEPDKFSADISGEEPTMLLYSNEHLCLYSLDWAGASLSCFSVENDSYEYSVTREMLCFSC